MFKNVFDRNFFITLVVVTIFNLFLILLAVSYGYSGEISINPAAVSGMFGDVFGSLWSLAIFVVVVFIIFAVLWIGSILWKNSNKVPLLVYIAMLIALALLAGQNVDFEALNFGFVPVLAFLFASAIEAAIIKLAITRSRS